MENQVSSKQPKSVNNAIISFFNRLNSFVNPIDKMFLRTPLKNIPATQRRFLILFSGVFGLFIIMILITGVLFKLLNNREEPVQEITPVEVGKVNLNEGEITNPSNYLNDPEVLNLNIKINEVQKSLDSLNVNDSQLTPPSLKYDIEF